MDWLYKISITCFAASYAIVFVLEVSRVFFDVALRKFVRVGLTAAGLFAQAGMFAHLQATQKDDYPITVMTGHSITEIILSPAHIDYTAIDSPDYFVVISEDGLQKCRGRMEKLASSATLYAEESLELPATAARVVRLPLVATSKKANRLSIGVLALAAMLRDSGLFPLEALRDAITAFQRPAIAEVNLRAVEAGSAAINEAMVC